MLNSCSTAAVSYLNEEKGNYIVYLFVSDVEVSFTDDFIGVREDSGPVEVCVELSLTPASSTTAANITVAINTNDGMVIIV